MMEQLGQDGYDLLKWVGEGDSPPWLKEIPAVENLRKIWIQQFFVEEGKVKHRSNDDLPPASKMIASPYDTEARLGVKRETEWTGYKVHFTETCDDDLPHVIIHVETTKATVQDVELTERIHQTLEKKQLLPAEHFLDAGYVDAEHLVTSEKRFGVEVIGPVGERGRKKGRGQDFYTKEHFLIDWEKEEVTCPEGKTSKKWTEKQQENGKVEIRARFGQTECRLCAARSRCTSAAVNPRQVVLHPREQHEALVAAREQQATKAFQERYATRSGIEGTISQGVRANDLRTSRYLGQRKTHLKHLLTAAAMNVTRLYHWWRGDTPALTRISSFAALAA
jgi:transposase